MSDRDVLVMDASDRRELSPMPQLRPLKRGYRRLVWSDPRLLSAESQRRLESILIQVSGEAFHVDRKAYWERRSQDHFFDKVSLLQLIVDDDSRVVGYTSHHRLEVDGLLCFYADMAAILPEHQGRGLLKRAQQLTALEQLPFRHPGQTVYLVSRTRNPIIFLAEKMHWSAIGERSVWPTIGEPTPRHIQRIAEAVADHVGLSGSIDLERLMVKDAFDPETRYEFPASGNPEVDEFFSALGPDDAYLTVMNGTAKEFVEYLVKLVMRYIRQGVSRPALST
ncbi:hypothetical protein [Nocardia sp. NPDC051570]|uniref:hypothetical protein n=1 Tax=Nocardia sp. NPDC051570 TaxID=3364324 RepID=UPI00379219DF